MGPMNPRNVRKATKGRYVWGFARVRPGVCRSHRGAAVDEIQHGANRRAYMLRQKQSVGTVAVIAHQKKSLGGGLDELRRLLADEGVGKLLWYEVPKSKKAPKQVRKALKEGADLVLVWGGDGMVQ